jgi:hypothetical protein
VEWVEFLPIQGTFSEASPLWVDTVEKVLAVIREH